MRPIQILAIVLLCFVAVLGQTNKGGISGTVMDSNGAAIPGATVTITNLGTNQSATTTTSETGAFSAQSLDPVTYSVTVEAANFKKALVESVKVDTATTVPVNVTLEAGAVSEQVSVVADAPLLNTESGSSSTTITERQLQDVPLFNRSVLDLAVTTPNVSGDTGSEDPGVTSGSPAPGYNLSLGGGRPGSSTILADGVNNTGVGVARQVVSFSPETVQEFTVQTSAFSAEYGQTGGGVINATTKSGTNNINGVLLWYTRNPATNARVWGIGALRPKNNLRTNQVSATLGGPVVIPKIYNGHNRTFFFFAFEPRWRRDFLVTDTLLPTDAMRAGDFSGLTRLSNGWAPSSVVSQFPSIASQITDTNPHIYQQFTINASGKFVPLAIGCPGVGTNVYCAFPGDKIPQNLIDPIAVKAYEFLPHAGAYFINGNGQLANYVVNRFVRQDEVRYTTRIDHQISNSNRINFRYSLVPVVGEKGFGSEINGNSGAYSTSKQIVVGDNHVFSASVVNDLKLNYTRGVFSDDFTPAFGIKSGRNLATELGLPSLTAGGLPLFNMNADGVNAFASIGSSGSTNNFNVEERFGISDTVYWTRGNKTWKFGVDLNHALLNVTPFFGASGGSWIFRVLNTSNARGTAVSQGGNVFASYLLGVPNNVLVRPSLLPYYYRWNSGALFVQNDWKVRPNLTLNLGLRYSLQLPRTEKNNLQGVYRPDLAQTFNFPTTLPAATQSALNLIKQATGKTISSAVVVPFAFSGVNGRSKYLYDPQYTDFEPRFGFAWSPKLFGLNGEHDRAVVIRGGYGLSHFPLTGNNRLPNPDFGATVSPSTIATGSTGTADTTQPVRFSTNPPFIIPNTVNAALGVDSNGLTYLGSLGIPGEAIFSTGTKVKTPYTQSWNLTLSYELMRNTVLEVAYSGAKGSHLFLPLVNTNPQNFATVEAIEGLGNTQRSDTLVPDPLGRKDLSGNVISVPIGSLDTTYAGFNHLYVYFNPSGTSIRHAAYISLNRRVSRGLTLTTNYTYGKSLDTASDASPDKNVLTSGTAGGGHVTFGAPLNLDRSLSLFDIKHSFATTYIYDLPVGRNRTFLKHAWKPLDWVLGGWTTAGVFRLQSGFPFIPVISDTNRLSQDLTHTIRPDIVPGVPLKNPLWNRNCPLGNLCEPYVNPAAFIRPAKGTLGNAPRTLDIRGPIQRYFDMSFQKNFPLPFGLGSDGKRRVQFRVDLNNAFNHPNFRIASGTLNSANDFMGLPAEFAAESGTNVPLTTAEYNTWAAFNGQPLASTAAGAAQLAAIRAQVNAFRPGGATGAAVLPLDFFHIQLPQGFATTNANTFDIRTLQGFKLYRLRNAYGANFGNLRELGLPRYVQFGIKVYF
jgi:hypothetical protein